MFVVLAYFIPLFMSYFSISRPLCLIYLPVILLPPPHPGASLASSVDCCWLEMSTMGWPEHGQCNANF